MPPELKRWYVDVFVKVTAIAVTFIFMAWLVR